MKITMSQPNPTQPLSNEINKLDEVRNILSEQLLEPANLALCIQHLVDEVEKIKKIEKESQKNPQNFGKEEDNAISELEYLDKVCDNLRKIADSAISELEKAAPLLDRRVGSHAAHLRKLLIQS